MENDSKSILDPADSFLEQKKNQLLRAFYDQDTAMTANICDEIVTHAEDTSGLDEYSLKLLNQIRAVIKKCCEFKNSGSLDQKKSIRFKNYRNRLKHCTIPSRCPAADTPLPHIDFPTWEKTLDLNETRKELLYKTAMTFQLTSGCSNFCRRCNEWALPKVRSHFTYSAIIKILKGVAKQKNNDISLYGASDPLDWEEGKFDICDIIRFLKDKDLGYSILTKVPKGKETVLHELIQMDSNLSVSITSGNKTRVKEIERSLHAAISKQHDLDELLIPAGLDEDFMSIKPSITDGYGTEITPDGAFIIIPTFTSALHPFGHKKIRVTRNTAFFPLKKVGREALLVDYFKPLQGYGPDKEKIYLTTLLDVQVESIILDNGTDELTPPGMRSLKEFFFIFEKAARRQRKKMTPSVLKNLKLKYLSSRSFKQLPIHEKSIYRQKIQHHLDLCKKENCEAAKCHAISFFLGCIHHYCGKNADKTGVLRFLLKNEAKIVRKACRKTALARTCEDILLDPDLDSFAFFRFYILSLLNRWEKKPVVRLLHTFPSGYDPVTDIFCRTTSTGQEAWLITRSVVEPTKNSSRRL